MYIMQMKDKAFKLCSMKFVSSCFGPIKEGNTCRNDMYLRNVWGSKKELLKHLHATLYGFVYLDHTKERC